MGVSEGPGEAMSAPVSATKLLKQLEVPLDAASFLAGMELAGLLEERQYVSSSGSGEVKRYKALTDTGLAYGVNAKTLSPEKTEVRFYGETFPQVLLCSIEALRARVAEISLAAGQVVA